MARFKPSRPGFALPAVLAVTGMVTLVFLVAITALASLQAEARSARERVRFLQRAMTAEASLAYMMATEPFRASVILAGAPRNMDDTFGLNLATPVESGVPVSEIRLDGRPYLMDQDGPMVVRLQDAAGLVNLARTTPDVHQRLATLAGLPPSTAQAAYARYVDYVDPDDLRTLNGAERRDYGAAGGPPDRHMLRPSEWLSLLGVRDGVDPRKWNDVRHAFIVEPEMITYNVNTAPAIALQAVFDISAGQAESAIRRREVTPFASLEEFLQTVGSTFVSDPMRLYTYPGGRVIYEIRDGRSAWTYRGMIVLTPGGVVQPLWITQTELMEAPRRAAADTTNATRFPYTPY